MTGQHILMGLGAALLVIAAVLATVLYEYVSYRRKQMLHNHLHERMGLAKEKGKSGDGA